MTLKEAYEQNVKYQEQTHELNQEIEKTKAEYEKKLKQLNSKKEALKNKNTNEYDNGYCTEKVNDFIQMVKKESGAFGTPALYLKSDKVNGNPSTYQFFKKQIQNLNNKDYILVKITTPIKRDFLDRDLEYETHTLVEHLLIPENLVAKILLNLKNLTKEQYTKIKNLKGIYVLSSNYTFGEHSTDYEILDENNVYYYLYLNESREKRGLLLEPLTPSYDKELESILFNTLMYSLKINKLQRCLNNKEQIKQTKQNLSNIEQQEKQAENDILQTNKEICQIYDARPRVL